MIAMEEVARLLNEMVLAGIVRDFARILALRESGAVTESEISTLAARHGLSPAWKRFQERFDAG